MLSSSKYVRALVGRAIRNSTDHFGDWLLGIDTTTGTRKYGIPGKLSDSTYYLPVNYLWLSRLFAPLRLSPGDIVFDIGAGAGRVVCYLARQRIQRVVGIEVDPTLAGRAEENLKTLSWRLANAEIVCADALTVDYSVGSVFFLYRPFGADSLRMFLAALAASLRPERVIRLCFCDTATHFEDILVECGWLRRVARYQPPCFRTVATYWIGTTA